MASGNTVELVFAGDSARLEKTFAKVGSSAKSMAGDLDKTGSDVSRFGGHVAGMNDKVDASESKFMGAADLLDGLGGAFGLPTEGVTNMARAFGDMAGGFTSIIGPAITKVAGMLGFQTAATAAQTTATGTATAAQWSLNAAISANPIGAIVVGITLLVGALILAYKNSETFRDIVKGAIDVVKNAAMGLWNFFKDIGPMIFETGKKLVEIITWPYRTAFNAIASLWNNTVGKLSFEVPSWIPGIGGKGFSMPKLPTFHTGGTVPGPRGSEVAILAMAGETVAPAGSGGAGGPIVIQLVVDGQVLTEIVHTGLLRKQNRTPLGIRAA